MPETTIPEPTVQDEVDAALTPVIERGTLVLRADPEISLKDLATEITSEPPVHDPLGLGGVMPFPKIPEPVVLTDADIEALRALPEVFGKVNITERRVLTPEENAAIFREQQVVKAVLAVMSDREDSLKEYVRTSFDVQAEADGIADPATSPRDAAGHYVLGKKGAPERLPIPGTNKAWSREARGGSVSLSGARLEELYANGAISKEEYYAFTREVRVFDEKKARASIAKNPRLLGLLSRITQRGGMSSALFVRKNA